MKKYYYNIFGFILSKITYLYYIIFFIGIFDLCFFCGLEIIFIYKLILDFNYFINVNDLIYYTDFFKYLFKKIFYFNNFEVNNIYFRMFYKNNYGNVFFFNENISMFNYDNNNSSNDNIEKNYIFNKDNGCIDNSDILFDLLGVVAVALSGYIIYIYLFSSS